MMIDPTMAASGVARPEAIAPATGPMSGAPSADAPAFSELLVQAVGSVNAEQIDARDALQGLASGENVDLHGTMIALEKAEISLRAMTSVRDRLIGAYEQVMNMAI